jgi:tetraacyldisaccharide 4'-kinase
VPLEEPGWWYGGAPPHRLIAPLLPALSQVYGWLAQVRFSSTTPYRSRLPVICVGNFTSGGTGKTPLAILVANLLKERGEKPCFLTRGYGGSERGPAWVESGNRAAARFGDEPLLLANVAPTLVARNRAAGARCIEASGRGVTAIVMDDGLQNPSLAKDLAVAVVDAERGLGNGEVIPAGPLRAPIDFQLGLVDAVVVREGAAVSGTREVSTASGAPGAGIGALLRHRFPGPVLAARVETRGDTAWLAGARLVAFAGIANPDRFFALIERLGGKIAARRTFRDHHAFLRADADALSALAEAENAVLVTTEKDWIRLAEGESFAQALSACVRTLPIEMIVEQRDAKRLASLIDAAMRNDGDNGRRSAERALPTPPAD